MGNLRDVEELLDNRKQAYFKVVGGYTIANQDGLSRLNVMLADSKLREEAASRVRIGVQQDTQVTGAFFGESRYEGPLQLVTQAYCSACSVGYSNAAGWEDLASLVLDASYEATLLAAV